MVVINIRKTIKYVYVEKCLNKTYFIKVDLVIVYENNLFLIK